MRSIEKKERFGSLRRFARRFWLIWVVAAVLLVVGVVQYRGRFHYESLGCPGMDAQECDAAAENHFEGGVQAFADRILDHPDCPVLEPVHLRNNSAASPATCAELPPISDEAVRTGFAALGAHPELIDQINQLLVYDWSGHVGHPLDTRQFQRILDNRMTTLGAVSGGQFDAAASGRSDQTVDEAFAENVSQLQSAAPFTVGAAAGSGALQVNVDAEDTLDPYVVDGKVRWTEIRDSPKNFEDFVNQTDVFVGEVGVKIRGGQDNQIRAWEWMTGLSIVVTSHRLTE